MQVLSVRDAAKLLGVDAKTVYRLAERGQLPAFKVGRQWRMRLSDLETWIDRQVRVRGPAGSSQAQQTPPLVQPAKPGEANGPAGFSDPAFTENARAPIHRWVPWIAGFSAGFVEDALNCYLPHSAAPGTQCVLDPFAGVGTTLIAAMLRGHSVCGFEINPYAAAVCEFKLNVGSVPLGALRRAAREFGPAVERAIAGGEEPKSERPPGFTTRERFLAEGVERKVLLTQDFIRALDEPLVRRCFEVALAAELVGFSNYSYEPSLGTRTAAGRPRVEDAPVVRKVARKVAQMIEDIEAAQQKLVREGLRPRAEFRAGDFFKEDQAVADASVDLVVTSPPYLNNYHYIRNSRPQAYWLGLVASPEDMRGIEEGSFGKFWQTVRGGPEVALSFAMPDLEDAIAFLRGRNVEKGAYGGPGWANYAATYFNDCRRFALVLRRVLKPGGRAVVVLGNSILQGVEFRTDGIFGRICEQAGLAVQEVQPLRTKRTGASIIRSSVRAEAAKARTTLYESAVVLNQPSPPS